MCAGVFISSGAGAASVAPAVFFRSHLLSIYFKRFLLHAFRMTLRLRLHCNLLSLFVSGRTGCAPPNAPYVVYTDERGQVTCAACRTAPRTALRRGTITACAYVNDTLG